MAMTDRTRDAVCDIAAKLEAQGIRVETDLRNEKIGFKMLLHVLRECLR